MRKNLEKLEFEKFKEKFDVEITYRKQATVASLILAGCSEHDAFFINIIHVITFINKFCN